MKILIRTQNETDWKLVETASYGNEAELQHLLADSPGLISLSEVRDSANPLVLAVQEFSLPIGFIDILGFTAEGDIAVVECKLASNAEVKRKVIGQVLEYGAHLWGMSYEELDQAVQGRIGEPLADAVAKRIDSPDWDEEVFRANVEAALVEGNFILIIVVDEINDELTRTVRFMNIRGAQGFDFAALEMRRYHSQGTEMLIPRIFGPAQSPKSVASSSRGIRWDQPRFFEELDRLHGDPAAKAARRILDWTNQNKAMKVWWGKGKQSGSFVPCFYNCDIEHALFAVWTYGSLELYFQWYTYKPPFDTEEKREELRTRLNQIEGLTIPPNGINRRPSFPIAILAEDARMNQFFAVFNWVIEEFKKA